MTDRRHKLATLLRQAGEAHHVAFEDVGGDDPDWPQWYAEHMSGRVAAVVGRDVSTERLADLLSDAADAHAGSEEPWPAAYASYILDNT